MASDFWHLKSDTYRQKTKWSYQRMNGIKFRQEHDKREHTKLLWGYMENLSK